MARQSVIGRMSIVTQDPESLIKNIIYGNPYTGIGRKRATLREADLLRNISIIRVEFLCLKNTSLKNVNFVKYFINLWYLDIRDNPVKIFKHDFNIF